MLVGFDTSDDAGVYRLNDEQALVFTADFITPPVDDPLIYGQICLLYTSPSPRDGLLSRMPSSA